MNQITLGVIGVLFLAVVGLGGTVYFMAGKNGELRLANKTMADQAKEWQKQLSEEKARAETLDRMLGQREIEQNKVRYQNEQLHSQIRKLKESDRDAEIYLRGIIPDSVFNILHNENTSTPGS